MITIAWDVDDVLNNLTEAWLADTGPAAPSYHLLTANPPHACLGLSLDAFRVSLDAFRTRSFVTLHPKPEVLAWFRQHGALAHHLALTAVPRRLASVSSAWTFSHFGDWIRSYAFVPSPRPSDTHPSFDLSKGDFLSRQGNINMLIEDNETNVIAARKLGIQAFLFPQPWNSARDQPVDEFLANLTEAVRRPLL